MKRTFTLSISGRIFQVEEDAYAFLLDYLESLSQLFKGSDGEEIVNDIEARISDLFQEQVDEGKIVFTIADAERVISIIGKAEEIAAEDDSEEYVSSQQASAFTESQTTNNANACPPPPEVPCRKKFYRSERDKVMGGVIGGAAIRFGVSALPMRIIVVLLTCLVGFFPMFLAYCAVWAITPAANTPERILEQEGRPVTVANIGEILSMQAIRPRPQSGGETFLHVVGALIMGFIGILSGGVGFATLIGFVALLICSIGTLCHSTMPELIVNMCDIGHVNTALSSGETALAYLIGAMVCLAILIPCIAMVWAACSVLFKVKGASRTLWIAALVVETAAIAFICIAIPCLL